MIQTAVRELATYPAMPETYLAAWTETFRTPAFVCSSEYHVLWSNSAAITMFEAGEPFLLSGSRLQVADKAQAASFQSFIADLESKTEPGAWIYRADHEASLLIRGDAVRVQGQAPAVGLMIYATGAQARYVWGDFGRLLGLTSAETGVVKRLVGGETVDIIAENLIVSVETIRTHIRRIYNKLNISSREQLIFLINPFQVR